MLIGMGIISTYRCIWCLVYNFPAFRLLLFVTKDGLNICHGMGRHNKTAVVLFDCGFLCLNTATTIAAVMSTKYEIRAESVPGRPKREKEKEHCTFIQYSS